MITYEDDEEDLAGDARSDTWCELLNAIEARPDCEIVFARAVAMIRILIDGPVEKAADPLRDWPIEL